MISKIAMAIGMTADTKVSHYAEFQCEFENDDDHWRPTDLDILVEGDKFITREKGCKAIPSTGWTRELQS